jgi:hypothetical protein
LNVPARWAVEGVYPSTALFLGGHPTCYQLSHLNAKERPYFYYAFTDDKVNHT